jgi:hypothetical protein
VEDYYKALAHDLAGRSSSKKIERLPIDEMVIMSFAEQVRRDNEANKVAERE